MRKDETEKLRPSFSRLSGENKKVIVGKAEALVFAQKLLRKEAAERDGTENRTEQDTDA